MRQKIQEKLKQHLKTTILNLRSEKCLTQEQMASELWMERRSYADLESGKNMMGLITFLRLLFLLDNPQNFLSEIQKIFLSSEDDEAA